MSDALHETPHLPDATEATPASMPAWRAAWTHWTKLGHAIGVVQTRILMVLFYFVMVVPTGLIMKLRGDPLRLRPRNESNWWPHSHQERSIEATRRQF